MVDPKTKIQGLVASAALKSPPLPPLPKPTTLELGGKKYFVLLIPMEMKELFQSAQKKGWHDCVHTDFEGYGYHVMSKNAGEVSEIGVQFLGSPLDEVLKKAPQISPHDIQRYALALEKLRQTKAATGDFERAKILEGKEVIVSGKVYEVIAIPHERYLEIAPLALKAGYKRGIILPGEGESISNVCGKELCHTIFVRTESGDEAQNVSIELLMGNYKPNT